MSSATSVAVMINSLTTMIGFGALMIAQHQGLQSLGRALTIGMACCLFSALILPNFLSLLRGGGDEVADEVAPETPDESDEIDLSGLSLPPVPYPLPAASQGEVAAGARSRRRVYDAA